ncbi:hypothetical protein D3C77_239930 [compost metagenome]
MLNTVEGADDANPGQVLPHDEIQLVDLLLNRFEQRNPFSRNQENSQRQHRQHHNKNERQCRILRYSHNDTADTEHRSHDHHPQDHNKHLLNLRNIVCSTRDQRGRPDLVEFLQGEIFHMAKHLAPQQLSEPCCGPGREIAGCNGTEHSS